MSTAALIEIVRAGPGDAEAVRRLVRSAYAKWVPLLGREPMPMTVDYDWAVREHEIDLLLAGDDLVALIETILYRDHLFIENVAVASQHQGRGFGRRMLRHADEKAGKAGLGEVRLLTNEAFGSNIRLYEAEGFAIDGRAPFMGGTTVYMSKRLAAS